MKNSTHRNPTIFAVIDIETNWDDEAMSIGYVIANDSDFRPIKYGYYVLGDVSHKGMYESALKLEAFAYRYAGEVGYCGSRERALAHIDQVFQQYEVQHLFAYNATFDQTRLPELNMYLWHDIVEKSAYKQYNPWIPAHIPTYKTGRMKSGYSAESVYQMVTQDLSFKETHNAYYDAIDELKIMFHLGHPVDTYTPLGIMSRKSNEMNSGKASQSVRGETRAVESKEHSTIRRPRFHSTKTSTTKTSTNKTSTNKTSTNKTSINKTSTYRTGTSKVAPDKRSGLGSEELWALLTAGDITR